MSELTVLKIALKLPPAMLRYGAAVEAARRYALTRRSIAIMTCALLLGLAALHWQAADPAVRRASELVARLAALKLIDARWDAAALHSRNGATLARHAAIEEGDAAEIQRVLDEAAADARTTALRTSIAELKKAYVEKADVLERLAQAAGDSRAALAAALRADAAITGLVREVWREFPQRERLVAAENLVLRATADAQQYHHAPSAAHRASLEASAAELSRPQTLPKPLQPPIARLESDIHRLLLLKPLEQMLSERLVALDTARRLDTLADLHRRELADALARRGRWRVALVVYTLALLGLACWLAVRAITRYRDLEGLYAGQTRELAKTRMRLRGHEQARRPEGAREAAREEARIVSEHRR